MVQASARILGQWLLSQSEACGVGCHGRGPQCSDSHHGASAFSFPVGMDRIDPLDCDLNVKLSRKLTFHTRKKQAPNGPTETALGVSPKGMVASPWSWLSVERGCRPDGPGRQPAAEVSSNHAKRKCLGLQVTGPSPPTLTSAHFLGLFHSLGLWQFGGWFLHQLPLGSPGLGKPQSWFWAQSWKSPLLM